MVDINSVFGAGGLLAEHLPNHEVRQAQIRMAEAVSAAIEREGQLIVEAGTGVGKSLAYLIPFLIWTHGQNRKAVISTYTKTLQHQLVEKDLPFLKKVMPFRFRFALAVGGQNYLCRKRFMQVQSHDLYESKEEVRQMREILNWEKTTETGLRSDLSFEPAGALWSRISREPDLCSGRKCTCSVDCYYQRARKLLQGAHILVLNHHLYFANLSQNEHILPTYDGLVFDEAHTLEDVAVGFLGVDVAESRVKNLMDGLFGLRTRKGFLSRNEARDSEANEDALKAVEAVRQGYAAFFDSVQRFYQEREVSPLRLRKPHFVYNSLKEPLEKLSLSLRNLKDMIEDEDERLEAAAFANRASKLSREIESVVSMEEPEHVYWLELQKSRRYDRTSLRSAPVDVAGYLKSMLFDRVRPLVMTSATLSTEGKFEYIKGRLGIDGMEELLLPSPFDFRRQAMIYCADDLPDPGKAQDEFQEKAFSRILELLRITGGRALVLFTSFRFLESTCTYLLQELPDYTVLRQGEKPAYKLIEEFKNSEKAVLLGTNSFWQGVDIPGKALECVIITKLPFAVPDEPVTEARLERIRSENKEPFTSYQLPQAIIWLKQGFGRLIRSSEDRGLVAILDPRIVKRNYGRKFIESLPKCLLTRNVKEIASMV